MTHFIGQSSGIPDSMWKAETPVGRQVKAASFWLDLTGRAKSPDIEDLYDESEKIAKVQMDPMVLKLANFLKIAKRGDPTRMWRDPSAPVYDPHMRDPAAGGVKSGITSQTAVPGQGTGQTAVPRRPVSPDAATVSQPRGNTQATRLMGWADEPTHAGASAVTQAGDRTVAMPGPESRTAVGPRPAAGRPSVEKTQVSAVPRGAGDSNFAPPRLDPSGRASAAAPPPLEKTIPRARGAENTVTQVMPGGAVSPTAPTQTKGIPAAAMPSAPAAAPKAAPAAAAVPKAAPAAAAAPAATGAVTHATPPSPAGLSQYLPKSTAGRAALGIGAAGATLGAGLLARRAWKNRQAAKQQAQPVAKAASLSDFLEDRGSV